MSNRNHPQMARMGADGFELSTICRQLKMVAEDGVKGEMIYGQGTSTGGF
jgi:hypothetical protein